MTLPRLDHALQTAALELPPDARLAFLEPNAEFDVTAFEGASVQVQQNDKPGYDRFAALGATVATHVDGPVDVVHVTLPRSRELARGLIAQAQEIAPEGLVIVDGAKTDGIDPALKAVKARTEIDGQLSKAHGKLFWFRASDAFSDWTLPAPAPVTEGWITQPGVFSADGPDAGSQALVAALPPSLKGQGADLGGGWGFLTRHLLALPKVTHVEFVEADHRALTCAKLNLDDDRVAFHWADATTWGAPASLDWVVTNPPFHTSRTPDASLGQAFIASAARLLKPKGQLILVANRHLPYETTLAARFVHVKELEGDARFKILHAEQPRSPDRSGASRRR
ncbi:methyltransferase [Marivita sp. S6314]|uniref:class I SAM-dependent methyltransferase n=1 Tax=Marivita sp. S6314 TaxID=2926406 RepID=UPI001FF4F6BC|nr:methyltransferase [Marivita sp. S6314]MCK0149876.1 methyltransferase [Marivita sp. S6314]